MNKQTWLIGAAVVLLVGAALLLYRNVRDPAALPSGVRFVCVQTGETFTISREKIIAYPVKNPKTGQATLLPCIEENGELRVDSAYRGYVQRLGAENKCVDAETLVVRAPK